MNHPRFSIANFMAVVFVFAINFAAGDFYFGNAGRRTGDVAPNRLLPNCGIGA
jgi:hypothetical protein